VAFAAQDGPDTGLASFAHLAAITGPAIPAIVYLTRRRTDPFVTREAAKATNAGMAFLVTFVVATLIEFYVPLVAFVGRLTQLAIVVVAVMVCVQCSRRVRDGLPTSYPFYIKVVKTHD